MEMSRGDIIRVSDGEVVAAGRVGMAPVNRRLHVSHVGRNRRYWDIVHCLHGVDPHVSTRLWIVVMDVRATCRTHPL